MEKIKKQKHSTETLFFSLSRMLERASYYGFRAIVILYLIEETLKIEKNEALSIYGWFTGSIVFSQIIGGLFGDLLIGNKKAVIIGGITQAIGAFSLCIPSTTSTYLGMFFVVLGSGFFTPNILSSFGKSYLNKTKLLDSGFTIFYLVVNIGSFLGILLIGYSGKKFGFNIGFIISGILMLLSIIPIIFSKEINLEEFKKNKISIKKRILNILITFIAVGLFWNIYEISNIRFFDLQKQFSEISAWNISKSLWQTISSIFTFPISLVAIVFWSFFYSSQFLKLVFGFIFGAISLSILFLIPEIPTENHTIIYLTSLIFLGISEIHIAPVIHSVLTKYANPKYLAILMSLTFLPTRLISLIFGLFNDKLFDNSMLGLKVGIAGMIFIGIGLIGFVWWNKKTTYNTL
ncbi:MFS transporter [Tenacibaculum sp. ZS6-P6]|uniref:MFS transporter n=1 Tax=Tenacibaculum sp. ZS6-P6 TaxID=3447503 RepID=UPI003F991827